MIKLVILASGEGTNAENIIKYFSDKKNYEVSCVMSNKKSAGVLKRAENLGVKSETFTKAQLCDEDTVLNKLEEYKPDLIILAGFLLQVPISLLNRYPNRIINIHPALLPKFGGKGMYGMNVHEAVVTAGEKYSGITIHVIDENYDKGSIILQEKTELSPNDTPDDVAHKVHELEYKYFPIAIEKYAESLYL